MLTGGWDEMAAPASLVPTDADPHTVVDIAPPPVESPYDCVVRYWRQCGGFPTASSERDPWRNAGEAVEAILSAIESDAAGYPALADATPEERRQWVLDVLMGATCVMNRAERAGGPDGGALGFIRLAMVTQVCRGDLAARRQKRPFVPLAPPQRGTRMTFAVPDGLELFVKGLPDGETPDSDESGAGAAAMCPSSPLLWIAHQCLSVGVKVNPQIETRRLLDTVMDAAVRCFNRLTHFAERAPGLRPSKRRSDSDSAASAPEAKRRRRADGGTEEAEGASASPPPPPAAAAASGGAPSVRVRVDHAVYNHILDMAAQSHVRMLPFLTIPADEELGAGVLCDYVDTGPVSKRVEGGAARCLPRVRLDGHGGRVVLVPPAMLRLAPPADDASAPPPSPPPTSSVRYIALKRCNTSPVSREVVETALSKVRFVTLPRNGAGGGTPQQQAEALKAFGHALNRRFPDTLLYYRTDAASDETSVCVCGLGCDLAVQWLSEDSRVPLSEALELDSLPGYLRLWPAAARGVERLVGAGVWFSRAADEPLTGQATQTPLWGRASAGGGGGTAVSAAASGPFRMLSPAASLAVEKAVQNGSRLVLALNSALLVGDMDAGAEPEASRHLVFLSHANGGGAGGREVVVQRRRQPAFTPVHRAGDTVRVKAPHHLQGHTADVSAVDGDTLTLKVAGQFYFTCQAHEAFRVPRMRRMPLVRSAPVTEASFQAHEGTGVRVLDFRIGSGPPTDSESAGEADSPALEASFRGDGVWVRVRRVHLENAQMFVMVHPPEARVSFLVKLVTGPKLPQALSHLAYLCEHTSCEHTLVEVAHELTLTPEQLLHDPSLDPPPPRAQTLGVAGDAATRLRAFAAVRAAWARGPTALRVPPHAVRVVRRRTALLVRASGVLFLECSGAGVLQALGDGPSLARLRAALDALAAEAAHALQRRRLDAARARAAAGAAAVAVRLALPAAVAGELHPARRDALPPAVAAPRGTHGGLRAELQRVAREVPRRWCWPGSGRSCLVGAVVSGARVVAGDAVRGCGAAAEGVVESVDADGLHACVLQPDGRVARRCAPCLEVVRIKAGSEPLERRARWSGTVAAVDQECDAAVVADWLVRAVYGPPSPMPLFLGLASVRLHGAGGAVAATETHMRLQRGRVRIELPPGREKALRLYEGFLVAKSIDSQFLRALHDVVTALPEEAARVVPCATAHAAAMSAALDEMYDEVQAVMSRVVAETAETAETEEEAAAEGRAKVVQTAIENVRQTWAAHLSHLVAEITKLDVSATWNGKNTARHAGGWPVVNMQNKMDVCHVFFPVVFAWNVKLFKSYHIHRCCGTSPNPAACRFRSRTAHGSSEFGVPRTTSRWLWPSSSAASPTRGGALWRSTRCPSPRGAGAPRSTS